MSKKIGILLINVGTPSAPTKEAVQTYLNEFLTDPSVIQAPAFVRNILFKKIIIPRRSPQSAKKYQKIWTDKGSPLLSFSLDFSNDLQEVMGPQYIVRVAMRYGEPSLQSVIQELKSQGVEKFWMAPVFPQFAEATTGSVIKKIKELLPEDNFQILNEFYKSDSFIKSCAQILESSRSRWDHLLFSYHGLPVGQLKKIPGCYSTQNCCELAEKNAVKCYRSQCLVTSQRLAQALGLNPDQWSVSFQSRLGPVKWIQPYTDDRARKLAEQGVKRLAVFAPSFVVDGLETLEELAIELKDTFLEAGGVEYNYIPCLNSESHWVKGFAEHLKRELSET